MAVGLGLLFVPGSWPRVASWGRRGAILGVEARLSVVLGVQSLGKVGHEQLNERFGEVCASNLFVDDPEACEHCLVQLSPYVAGCTEVQPMGIGAQQQHLIHHAHHGIGLYLATLDDLPSVGQFVSDALLLGLEQVKWDGVGVPGLQELQPLVFELPHSLLLALQLRLVAGLLAREASCDVLADAGCLGLGEVHPHPPVGHRCLDVGNEYCGLRAVLPLGSAKTVEVRVDRSPAVLDVADPHP
ncbi:hypothetical protein [Streptomyces broussonetiae]|uniref:Uncharacterized protein n=1 Tax=Streptomyces broussonetiae TaxID=2686304 RepID=A0ABV5EJY1_9ACTN